MLGKNLLRQHTGFWERRGLGGFGLKEKRGNDSLCRCPPWFAKARWSYHQICSLLMSPPVKVAASRLRNGLTVKRILNALSLDLLLNLLLKYRQNNVALDSIAEPLAMRQTSSIT